MATNGLTKRVDMLEAIAEEARIAPYRRKAAEYGIPLDVVLATVAEISEFVSFYFRGTCSHQPAVKAREDRERAALQTSDRYPVRPTDPYHYCPCGVLIARSRRRCDVCAERGV
jgi:hypothetical protein